MKVSKYLKVIFINFTIFLALIIIFELFLGSWFKNNFNYKLSSDRNINRVYKLDFKYHKTTSHYIKNNYAFRISNISVFKRGGYSIRSIFWIRKNWICCSKIR